MNYILQWLIEYAQLFINRAYGISPYKNTIFYILGLVLDKGVCDTPLRSDCQNIK